MSLHAAAIRAELQRFAEPLAFAAPRSAGLLNSLAAAIQEDGAIADLMTDEPALAAPMAGVRVLAAVNELVLAGQLPDLRQVMYLDDPDCPPPCQQRVWELAREAILNNADQVRAALTWPVQQHTPERAGILLRGLAMLQQPRIRLLEIGACAGLLLLADRYHWSGPGWTWGPPAASVRMTSAGPAPAADLTIVERAGCDLDPVDPADPVQVRRLHAFIPPELTYAHRRLDAALAVARAERLRVEKAGGSTWLSEQLGQPPARGVHTVVWHGQLWHLLDRSEQRRIEELVTAAAYRFPVTYITSEPRQIGGRPILRIETFN